MKKMTVTEKILLAHLASGKTLPEPGEEIALRVDQTLTQDATGTMVYLQFESMGIERVKTELSVAYVDHNTLGTGFENADDHRFIASAAKKYGVVFSRPGNGICHQVHLERFGIPGKTLIGSDSHTPTAGGLGMLGIGAGGMDVAAAMGGGAYTIRMPRVAGVKLTGKLRGWAQAKDVILELLRRLTVKGGVGKVMEYFGDGVAHLSIPERATIANMGAELGATASVFPSDEVTRLFLKRNGREADFVPLAADVGAGYSEVIEIDLGELAPLVACPHSPDHVKAVSEVSGIPVDQVCVGSCTNSSLYDLLLTAAILKGRRVAPGVSLSVSPGSRQVLAELSACGALTDLIEAGARVLECACGPCIGMGNAPCSGGVSLRTFNRNFEGRSGTADASVYLVSPAVAAVSALTGVLTDPADWGDKPEIRLPDPIFVPDTMTVLPDFTGEVIKGPNIRPVPEGVPVPEDLRETVLLKVGDNITTDHIMPAGSHILPYRSNIPVLSRFCFRACDPDFAERARKAGHGIILGGENYGQGSSREHAALVPLFLGIRAVIARSFARIHLANLINAGIVPLTLEDGSVWDRIAQGDEVEIMGLREAVAGKDRVEALCAGRRFTLLLPFSPRQRRLLLAGGLLNDVRRLHHE